MRILFIHTGMESLGIEYLSSLLKKHGHDTALLYDPHLFRSFRFNIPFLDKDTNQLIANAAIINNSGLICFSVESDYFRWAVELMVLGYGEK